MKRDVYGLDGKVKESVELPQVFEEEFRPDLINRACLALRSHSYQPMGNYPRAGLQTSAFFRGTRHGFRSMNAKGMARLPRIKEGKGRIGAVRRVPQAVKGRRAHGPKIFKKLHEKINDKERKKAIKSALGATTDKELVKKRGHKITTDVPLIIIDDFESVKKTKEIKDILKKLKLENELERGEKKKIRAGRGTTRGRKYKRKRSVLIVAVKDKGILKAAKNIPGVDVCLAKDVNAELLAPGGDAGRIAVYTKSAVTKLGEIFK